MKEIETLTLLDLENIGVKDRKDQEAIFALFNGKISGGNSSIKRRSSRQGKVRMGLKIYTTKVTLRNCVTMTVTDNRVTFKLECCKGLVRVHLFVNRVVFSVKLENNFIGFFFVVLIM